MSILKIVRTKFDTKYLEQSLIQNIRKKFDTKYLVQSLIQNTEKKKLQKCFRKLV